jgi:Ran GTPase-activating protein (RanGAP) involved in mRNA processing and transport
MSLQLENVLTNIPKDVWRDVLIINRTDMLRLVSKNIKIAIDLIQPFTNIEMAFDISDFKYRITAEKIIKALKKIIKISFRCSIQKLYLVQCDIKRESAFQYLAKVITNCKYIEELNLSNNGIDNNGMNIIAENLIHCSEIKQIKLGCNHITNFESLQVLADCKKLTLIDINTNIFGDIGAISFANVIVNCENISRIVLNNNDIGPEGIERLAVVFENLKYLTSINLSSNRLSSTGITILARHFKKYSKLFSLDISYNHIGDGGADNIASALPYCKSLTNIDLCGNLISDDGANCFKNVFTQCLSLRYINLDKNKISNEGSDSLAEVLSECPNIICSRCI